ncbi:hypothetical protein LCGC14_0376630 [marine sediment metagenome]|uniref:Uncharacterized protein n=1 Tax=marine sediment metagenome TaxID=412755 RepID=A0A0F9TLM0_9ZZZZ
MEAYQERVVEEAQELEKKLVKLVAFCRTKRFEALSSAEQCRMIRQRLLMTRYGEVLGERIEAF